MSTFHLIPWSSDLQVGVPDIDDEHALLVTLYNDVVHATNQGVSRQTRDGIVRSLKAYAVFHMDHEEAWMLRYGYPDIERHRKQHAEFKAAIDILCTQPDEQACMASVAGFLHGWILGHLSVDDRALFEWTNSVRSTFLACAAE